MPSDLARSPVGHLEPTVEGAQAFVPEPLPRAIELSGDLVYQLDEASRAVATLSGVGETLPNPHLLIEPFVRREAVLSSRIEGTQASLSDVYAYEARGRAEPASDAREVANYVAALDRGRALLADLPISGRLILELHAILMRGVRGEEARPGEYRTRQVWIGAHGTPIEDARFVPPPHTRILELMADWERFVHDEGRMPPLVRCALMHYEFETIHPFIDGNGRIGRLLIPLFLIEREVLPTPLLYLSAYFERRRGEYYAHLQRVSATGEWQPWLQFFLAGMLEQARDAIERSRKLQSLREAYRQRLQTFRSPGTSLQLLDEFFMRPVMSRRQVAQALGITVQGVGASLGRLQEAGLVQPLEGSYPQLYVANELMEVLT